MHTSGAKAVTKAINRFANRLSRYNNFADEADPCQYFTYDAHLSAISREINETYQVSEKAKGNTVFERAVSLMDWLHRELFSVGEHITPLENNTHAIMGIRKTGALFCWYQSIALAEMLISAGITARVIMCLPEKYDHDTHMAVLVFDHEKSRWFFMDPTFNTFFASDTKDALDIFEIRDMYAKGELPKFRPIMIDKRWVLKCCGIECATYDEWYTLYMAKNMFRFMSPADTFYNCLAETSPHFVNSSWIAVNPLNYNHQNEYDREKNITYTHCKNAFLHNPSLPN